MDEIRCPMCGSTNPPEAAFCVTCQASLQPISPEETAPEGLEHPISEETGIGPGADFEAPAGQDHPLDEADGTEWEPVRADSGDPHEELQGIEDGLGGGIADWLKSLQDAAGEPFVEEPGESSEVHKPESTYLQDDDGDGYSRDPDAGHSEEITERSEPDRHEDGQDIRLSGIEIPTDGYQVAGTPESPPSDWLRMLQYLDESTPIKDDQTSPADEIPEWLKDLESEAPGETSLEPGPLHNPMSDLPAWLSETDGESFTGREQPVQITYSADGYPELSKEERNLRGEVTGGSKDGERVEPDLGKPESELELTGEEDQLDSELEVIGEESEPDEWLLELGTGTESLGASEQKEDERLTAATHAGLTEGEDNYPEGSQEPIQITETTDTGSETRADEIETNEEGTTLQTSVEEHGVSAREYEEVSEPDQPSDSPDDEPASDLDDNISRLKAGETLAEDMDQIDHGPLSGIQGVLPCGDIYSWYRSIQPVQPDPVIGDRDQKKTELLGNLMSAETVPLQALRDRGNRKEFTGRLIAGLVLILLTIFPLLFGSQQEKPFPIYTAPETRVMYEQIEQIPEGFPVLIVADYSPGYAAEVGNASIPVLQHLILRRANLAFVSTHPMGPALIEGLLDESIHDLEQRAPETLSGYQRTKQTANLGYLAGGLASLQEFSIHPRSASLYGLGSGMDGHSVWTKPFLNNVKDLNGFLVIFLLTDSLDGGRAWLEQVQPGLKQTPLFLVTSTYAAPILNPYLDSGQSRGSISGLPGSLGYRQLLEQDEGARLEKTWLSYKLGLIAGAVLLLGSVINEIIFLPISRRRKNRERNS